MLSAFSKAGILEQYPITDCRKLPSGSELIFPLRTKDLLR